MNDITDILSVDCVDGAMTVPNKKGLFQLLRRRRGAPGSIPRPSSPLWPIGRRSVPPASRGSGGPARPDRGAERRVRLFRAIDGAGRLPVGRHLARRSRFPDPLAARRRRRPSRRRWPRSAGCSAIGPRVAKLRAPARATPVRPSFRGRKPQCRLRRTRARRPITGRFESPRAGEPLFESRLEIVEKGFARIRFEVGEQLFPAPPTGRSTSR